MQIIFTEAEISSAGGKSITNPANIDQIVQDILADMSLKEKAAIANLDKDKVPLLQPAFTVLLSDKLGVTSF